MPHLRPLAVAALALCALLPAPAAAHEGSPDYLSRIDAVTPKVDGLDVSVLNRDDRFLLVNRSGRTVVLEGYEGEPYARVAADGTVSVNLRSKAHYINEERDGNVPVPAAAGPRAAPRWRVIGRAGRFEWHDHRMHWMGKGRPRKVTDPDVRTKVFDYVVPLRVGDRPGRIAGTLFWTPRPGGDLPLGAIVAFAVVVSAASIAVFVVRRRRDGDGGGDEGRPAAEAW